MILTAFNGWNHIFGKNSGVKYFSYTRLVPTSKSVSYILLPFVHSHSQISSYRYLRVLTMVLSHSTTGYSKTAGLLVEIDHFITLTQLHEDKTGDRLQLQYKAIENFNDTLLLPNFFVSVVMELTLF